MHRHRALALLGMLLLLIFFSACIRVASDAVETVPPAATAVPATLPPIATVHENPTALPPTSTSPAVSSPAPTPALQTAQLVESGWEISPLRQFAAAAPILDLKTISLDGGPLADLLLLIESGTVQAFSADGDNIWTTNQFTDILSIHAADLDSNLLGELIIGRAVGLVMAQEEGRPKWEYVAPDAVTALTVIPGARQPETALIIGTGSGFLVGLDPAQNPTWQARVSMASISAIRVLDNGDLAIFQEDGRLTFTTSRGETLRDVKLTLPASIHPLGNAIVSHSAGRITVWEGDGRTLEYALPITQSTVAVIDGGIIAGDSAGILTRLDTAAELLWQRAIPTSTGGAAEITALTDWDNGNGESKMLVGQADGTLSLLNNQGELLAQTTLEHGITGLNTAPLTFTADRKPVDLIAWGEGTISTWSVADPTAPLNVAAPPIPSAADLPQYTIDVLLDYDGHAATVSQQVAITNNSGETWSELIFHAAPAYWPGQFDLETVSLFDDGETAVPLSPILNNTMMTLPLPNELANGETAVITFDYTLNLPRLDPLGWAPVGNAGWAPGVLQMGDWYPTLVPYTPGSGWVTWQFTPVGDPVINRLADFTVRIDAPLNLHIAAPGYLGMENSVRSYALQNARAFAFLASPDYVHFPGNAGDVEVHVYISTAFQEEGPTVLRIVQNAITLFTELYGPYPYAEFVIAQNGYLTAMEYSAIVSLSGFSFNAYNGRADSLLEAITVHEVSHQWWYGAVGNDQVNEPWIDESLAMLSELLYYERYHPELVDWWWQFRVEQWNPGGFVDVTIYDYNESETFVHNMYGQAARFIRDLRAEMGETDFNNFLRAYYARYSFNFVDREAFFATAKENTTVDLDPLFARYFRE